MNTRDEHWLDQLNRARAYFAEHQRQPPGRDTLGQWLASQRSLYRSGRMRADRAELLAAEGWWSPGRQRSVIVDADFMRPDYPPPDSREFPADFLAGDVDRRPMNLRETWLPNQCGVPACIWCEMPAAHCVIKDPCGSRKRFEEYTACSCNRRA